MMAIEWSNYESTSHFIYLDSTKSIAEHSFIVQKSVSYLDLSLSEYSSYKQELHKNKIVCFKKICNDLSFAKSNFLSTQESSKKKLVKNRKLLYTYHLDTCTELEMVLKNLAKQEEFACNYDGVVLNGVVISSGLYERLLHQMVVARLFKTKEVNFVKSVLKVVRFVKFPGKFLSILSRCLEILYSQSVDLDIIKEFSARVQLEKSDVYFLSPKIFEYFLRHADCKDSHDDEFHRRQEWINSCISSCRFEQVGPLLQFYNAPRFSSHAYVRIKKSLLISCGLMDYESEVPVLQGWITQERSLLILQTLDLYYGSQVSLFKNSPLQVSGFAALRMVWSSIPDILISLDELVLLFKETRISRDIRRIHKFYSGIVGEEALVPQPRKLKDYCRVKIRKMLCESGRLPDGIGQLNVSRVVQSFLKLEQTWL